jgi:hypothetical protein
MSLFTKAALTANPFRRIGVAAYFAGGTLSITNQTTVDKFALPSDSRSTLSSGLPAARAQATGFADAAVAGYVAGGNSGSAQSTVYKFAFPNDTVSTLGTGLSAAGADIAGCQDEGVAGYAAGGFSRTTTVNKFAFPSDTRSTITALSTGRDAAFGMSNKAVACYVAGGVTTLTSIEKYAFPSDTRSTIAAVLSPGEETGGSLSNNGVAGFTSYGTRCQRLSFVDETVSSANNAQSTGRVRVAGASECGGGFGYLGGGFAGSTQSTVDKYGMGSQTLSTLSSGLSSGRNACAGFANA